MVFHSKPSILGCFPIFGNTNPHLAALSIRGLPKTRSLRPLCPPGRPSGLWPHEIAWSEYKAPSVRSGGLTKIARLKAFGGW